MAKSLLLVPVIVIDDKVRAADPLFFRVTLCGVLATPTLWVAKVRMLEGERVTAGVCTATPVPLNETVCGLPAALSVS